VSHHRCPEALRLAVDLYARRDDVDGETVLHAADILSDWLATCPPQLPAIGAQILASLETVLANQEKTMTEQAQIDTDVQALSGVLTTIQSAEQVNATAVAAVAAAFAAAQQANPAADLSGLDALINGSADGTTPGLVAAAASVTAGVAAVQGLVPAAPVAPPVVSN
jgi:hypothetical protein